MAIQLMRTGRGKLAWSRLFDYVNIYSTRSGLKASDFF